MFEAYLQWNKYGHFNDSFKAVYLELRPVYGKLLQHHRHGTALVVHQSLAETAECDQKLLWSKYKQNRVSSGPSHDTFDVDRTALVVVTCRGCTCS